MAPSDKQQGLPHPRLWSVPGRVMATLRHFWATDVNVAAVDWLAPSPGDRVVDLGAGFGPATGLLAERVGPTGTVIAIDPSKAMRMIVAIRKRLARRAVVDIRKGTAESLPLADASVDAIVSLNAMHHMDDLAQAAAEMHRVLRPGGKILLIDEDFGNPGHSMHQAADHPHHGPEAVDPEEVAAILANAGLINVTAGHRPLGDEPALVVRADR